MLWDRTSMFVEWCPAAGVTPEGLPQITAASWRATRWGVGASSSGAASTPPTLMELERRFVDRGSYYWAAAARVNASAALGPDPAVSSCLKNT